MSAIKKYENDCAVDPSDSYLSREERCELREIKAEKIVTKYMFLAMGAGFIPIPMVDLGTLSVLQLRMLKKLSAYYGVRFSKNIVKSLISTLMGFAGGHSLRGALASSALKSLPMFGTVSFFTMPVYCGAATYSIGKLFVQHFESGGTFLNLKPYKVREHFKAFFEEGRDAASHKKTE